MNKIKQGDGMNNDTVYVASFDISIVETYLKWHQPS